MTENGVTQWGLPADYLPHRPPLLILERIVDIAAESVTCEVSTAGNCLKPFLNADGTLPSWYGVELMAQTVGVWAGRRDRDAGRDTPQVGLILSVRGYSSAAETFPCDSTLRITMHLLMQEGLLASFEGTISIHDLPVAEGRLSLAEVTGTGENLWGPQK